MRRMVLPVVLLACTVPGLAAKRAGVDQLEELLKAAASKPDAEVAWQIADLEPAERISAAQLAHLKALAPGEKSQLALAAVADESAFLEPSPTDIPAQPAPDAAEQRRIMGLFVAYVGKTIPLLPNFLATRETRRFEDAPQVSTAGVLTPYEPLHWIGDSSVTVLYRDGQEAVDSGEMPAKHTQQFEQGLTTWGVFGPILSTVLLDAAHSKLAWSRWEQTGNGLAAVFSFTVPRESSHYEVNYCCVAEQAGSNAANVHLYRQLVAYHGEMAVDPRTGNILRLAVMADMKTADPVLRADIVVEYAPVEIGGKEYICPVRSISSSVAQSVQVDLRYHYALARQIQPLKKSVNETEFVQYHLFRGNTRVLTDMEARNAAAQPPPVAIAAGQLPPLSTTSTEAASSAAATSAETLAASNTPAAAPVSAPTPAPAPAADAAAPEMSTSPASGLPDLSDSVKASAGDAGFTVRTTARLVDVSIVALDKKGRPITDLKPDDFEVDDNGRKQEVRFFTQGQRLPGQAETAEPEQTVPADGAVDISNRRIGPAAAANSGGEPDATVLLIDASNLAFSDLSYAREEMLRFLKTLAAGQRAGIYILKSHGFEVLLEPTADRNAVAQKLSGWTPDAQDLARAQDEERRNRQQMEFVHSKTDLAYVNGNAGSGLDSLVSGGANAEAPLEATPVDAQLLELGSNPGRDALSLLPNVARHLAAIAGHKSLIWVSSDNVLADWSGHAASREDKGGKSLDPLSLRAQEAMNEAHVSVYPLDASQLEAGGVAADIGTRNVLAMGKTDRDPGNASMGDAGNGSSPGRAIEQMHEDTRPVQGVFRDLADATGGRTFRRASDLAAELTTAVADGRAAYRLSFSPDTPADDKYHAIAVTVARRKDVRLHYRAGYLYSKDPVTIKDRFRQAVWQPADTNEIALEAKLVSQGDKQVAQLTISAPDLDLSQQGGRWTDKLDIFLVNRDDATMHARLSGQTLGLRLTPDTFQRVQSEGIPFEQNLDLSSGTGIARIVVIDENSGRIGSVTLPAGAH